MWLLARPGIRTSALQFQRDTGLKTYEAALYLLHKVRKALENPEKRPLDGPFEHGATWFETGELRDPENGPVLIGAVNADGTARVSIDAREPFDSLIAPTAEKRWTRDAVLAFFAELGSWLVHTHRGVSSRYLPRYIDEHLYRSNRRRLGWRTFGYLARRVMNVPWSPVPTGSAGPTPRSPPSGLPGWHPSWQS